MTIKKKEEVILQNNETSLVLGDVEIKSSKANLKQLTKTAETLLQNKTISHYLTQQYPAKRIARINGIG